MSPVVFLALALVVSVVGTVALWFRHRQSDTPDATIDEFRSKMRALADQEQGRQEQRRQEQGRVDDDGGRGGRGDATRRGG